MTKEKKIKLFRKTFIIWGKAAKPYPKKDNNLIKPPAGAKLRQQWRRKIPAHNSWKSSRL